MSVSKNSSSSDSSDREIVVSRVFAAPRELVWEAMTDPKQVVNWWGPRGFTTTIETMEVRPGGIWKHTMQGPDGSKYPNKSRFQDVVKPERIVYVLGGGREEGPGATFVATWTFEALSAKQTRLTVRMVFPSTEARDFVAKEFGALEGGKQTLERLSEHLNLPLDASEREGREIVTTRVMTAPRERVWKAWSDPLHLACWWGPRGFRNTFHTFDHRPGGRWLYTMHGPDGTDYENECVFRDIAPHNRIVFEHLRPGHWFHVTAEFEDLNPATRVTFRMRFANVEECEKVKTFVTGANEENFDRLEAELASMVAAAP